MNKIYKIKRKNLSLALSSLIMVILVAFIFGVFKNSVRASESCANATVFILAKNQNDEIIPGISFEILEQIANSDGEVRPGKKVASGKIDPALGEGIASFKPQNENYAVKMYDKNSSIGAFYFYDELTIGCGEEKSFTGVLSGLWIKLRDISGVLKKNANFKISEQSYDANGGPIKGAAVATLNTGSAGQNIIYLADSGRTIDRGPIKYVFSTAGYGGSEFILYDLNLTEQKIEELNYNFSELEIKFRDNNTNNLPVGTRVEFLTRQYDVVGQGVPGKLIRTLTIDNYGYISLEYPAGTYFLRIKKSNGDYHNFSDIVIMDRTRTSRTLDFIDNAADQINCAVNSTLNVIARRASGAYIPGIKFELYEKSLNANNQPAAGALMAKGAIKDSGIGSASFKPKTDKTYLLKMYEKNNKLGVFWYYDDLAFRCGETKTVSKNLSSISLLVRHPAGQLLKNYRVSLYAQKKDFDNNLLKLKEYLVAESKTGADGQLLFYASGGDPTQYQDAVQYLISIKYNNLIFDKPDINLSSGLETKIDYTLSSLDLTVADALNNNLAEGTRVDIYEQKIEANNVKIFTKNIAKITLNENSHGITILPAGVYAVALKDKTGRIVNFRDIPVLEGAINRQTIVLPVLRVQPIDDLGRGMSKVKIYIYSLIKTAGDWYQKNKTVYQAMVSDLKYVDVTLANGPYLVTFKQGSSEYGVPVLINSPTLMKINLAIRPENLVKPESVYKIQADEISAAPIRAETSSLAVRLKGYILLQVEENGRAWYVYPKNNKRYYLPSGEALVSLAKKLGLGIKNQDLAGLPIGIHPMGGQADCDNDDLPDLMETAIGTKICDNDSDNDGYIDSLEISQGYNPLGAGKVKVDEKLRHRLSGLILLQVESNGEAWYVNPADKKRYYMDKGSIAYKILKYLSLGIKNSDLNKIDITD